ncbi:uncharacterized protein LOC133420787 [Cololabis saira]|uniref:uncharacterized protein LOC133420787 n=1 Tax=Cololabis saira TaxID=129043 RepID=UPI002AD4165E|nr:uncharacterized protein LOC133420787 [Cololabis saira]
MTVTSLCLLLSATLNIQPNRSQFFLYDKVTLSCEVGENSGNWTLKKNSSHMVESCSGWGLPSQSACVIENVYPFDTGVYWCESTKGECSTSISITVTDGHVILDSPGLPVTEGDRITLLCYYKEEENSQMTSNFSANFYKDGAFIGTYPAGNMTFSAVSASDQGFYKCEHPSKGESSNAWMAVKSKVGPQPPETSPPSPVCTILMIVLHTVMLVACIQLHRMWAKVRAEEKRASDTLHRV